MMNEVILEVKNLSKTFRLRGTSADSVKVLLQNFLSNRKFVSENFQALKNISFHVRQGQAIGIIGKNGAGKSTLMRSIAGILPPTEGRITVNGKISTLLALGVGFNPALSGRDNIILGGLASGMSKEEIESKTDDIAAFADLPDGFIDMPVRTYSSGMYGRVAFSVAVNMTPDILLLDEALSAGDAAFKEKSFTRMRELCAQARTIVIVSHALATINELCDTAIWMHKGKMLAKGKPEAITGKYLKFLDVGTLPSNYEDM